MGCISEQWAAFNTLKLPCYAMVWSYVPGRMKIEKHEMALSVALCKEIVKSSLAYVDCKVTSLYLH